MTRSPSREERKAEKSFSCLTSGLLLRMSLRSGLYRHPNKESGYDYDTSAEGAAEAARDLRAAAGASMIRNRNFKNAQPGTGGSHLHLDVPAIAHLAHSKA